MKKILLLLLLTCISCSTNYYSVLLTNDTPFYLRKEAKEPFFIIPKNTMVYLVQSNSKFKKIKYNDYEGFSINPNYTDASKVNIKKSSTSQSVKVETNKTVHVKGYYRKNGTYVRPHTRSVPKRR